MEFGCGQNHRQRGLSRHDNRMVAYLDYLDRDSKGRCFVDLSDTVERRTLQYSLAEATREHQPIETKFELRDAGATWEIEDEDGEVEEGEKLRLKVPTITIRRRGCSLPCERILRRICCARRLNSG
jgi:hypothetical protein